MERGKTSDLKKGLLSKEEQKTAKTGNPHGHGAAAGNPHGGHGTAQPAGHHGANPHAKKDSTWGNESTESRGVGYALWYTLPALWSGG